MMIKRPILLLTILAALLAVAPAAQAKVVVGIGDQKADTFKDPLWQQLGLKRVRYIVPYDAANNPAQMAETSAYIDIARAAGQEVFVTFTARRGCYQNGRYSRSATCRAPSKSTYSKAVKAFIKIHPEIKVYGSWNEANSPSQPTYKNPKRAADYWSALRSACKRCTVMAGDLLDISNLPSYAKRMVRYTKGRAKLWGLHNYGDVNRNRSKGTIAMLNAVPGSVWLTETGGLYKFLPNFKPSESRQKKSTKAMFTLAKKYGKKQRGLKSKIVRLYPYQWRADATDVFDAGLVDLQGNKRPAYDEFAKGLRSRSFKK